MRVAFSGAHRTGKSTLLERVSSVLPAYETVDEPYFLLEEEGYGAAHPPSLEDFEAQLERSLTALREAGRDVLFDRCPADVLAYLLTEDDPDAFDLDAWQNRIDDAMATLDLVVFVGVESPDRIAVAAHEDRARRRAVDDQLDDLLVDDSLGWGVEVLRVEGDVAERLRQVMERIATVRGR